MGIREAKKYFLLDARSEKLPFLETFIFGVYSSCNYKGQVVLDIGAQTGDTTLYFAKKGQEKYLLLSH